MKTQSSSNHLNLLSDEDLEILEQPSSTSRLIMLSEAAAAASLEEPTVKPAPLGWQFAEKHGRTDVLTRLRPSSRNPTMTLSDLDLRQMVVEQSSVAFDATTIDQTVVLAAKHRRRLSDAFLLTDKLGEGGYGTVYLGESRVDGKTYAIKVFESAQAKTPAYRKRIFREARIAAAIEHPNIVKVMGLGVDDDGTPFIIMEHLRGETLENLLHRHGRIDIRLAVFIAIEACRGLSAAHELGVVHRDIKPANIFLTSRRPRPEIKILDFGLAKGLDDLVGVSVHSAADQMHGTPQYMSPEYCSGEPTDQRADVYGMAVVLYEMLAGEPPFTASSVSALIAKHISAAPPPLRGRTTPRITPALEDAVFRGLAKDPRARYQTAFELAKGLVDGFRRKPVTTEPLVAVPNAVDVRLDVLERHQRQLIMMIAAAFALLVVLCAALLVG